MNLKYCKKEVYNILMVFGSMFDNHKIIDFYSIITKFKMVDE